MSIVYVSCLISKNLYNNLFAKSKEKPGQQVQKYHRLMAEGFARNNIEVQTVSALPISRSNCSKKIIKRNCELYKCVSYRYITTFNIPVIKNINTLIRSFFATIKACRKDKRCVVICDILNISVATGALWASKLMGQKSVGIVTDVPNMLAANPKKWSVKFNNKIMHGFSSYIFLTEQMNTLINKTQKPYVVVEGQVDIDMESISNRLKDKYEKKVCMYTGALHKIYGIKSLVEAFVALNMPDTELHIYGSGDYQDELKSISRTHDNVHYFGLVPIDVVVKEQMKATLLINPRPSHQEFTKYSFPSKNMEYMASGTPTLTTLLPGMPTEYLDYVYEIEDESVQGLTHAMQRVLSRSREELHKKGMKAKRFVLDEKNNVKQAEKIARALFD